MLAKKTESQLTFACSKSPIETLKRCETCSKLSIKTQERRDFSRSGVFVVNFKHFILFSGVSIVDFEHVHDIRGLSKGRTMLILNSAQIRLKA